MENSSAPLRILAVVNLNWDARLGAIRVWLELAEQWRAAGHTVDQYCLSDAFPRETKSRPGYALRQVLFARHAAAYIREHGHKYDVIDALVGTLPFSKKNLRYRGLLVARSVGLYRLYERFEQRAAREAPPADRGKLIGRIYYPLIRRRTLRDSDRSVVHADLINVPNEEEAVCLRDEMDCGGRVAVLPYGLAPDRAEALAAAAQSAAARRAAQRVCFIGMWGPRKGSRDWARIIGAVREAAPAARFRFLGTMVAAEEIKSALGPEAARELEVIPDYNPDELPAHLADCTVGAFPSYVEGFGLAVIEKLAAGLPTVAYDTAGPRDILRPLPPSWLVPPGDVAGFASSVAGLLNASEQEYREAAAASLRVASGFSWTDIARDTIDLYDRKLREVRAKSHRP